MALAFVGDGLGTHLRAETLYQLFGSHYRGGTNLFINIPPVEYAGTSRTAWNFNTTFGEAGVAANYDDSGTQASWITIFGGGAVQYEAMGMPMAANGGGGTSVLFYSTTAMVYVAGGGEAVRSFTQLLMTPELATYAGISAPDNKIVQDNLVGALMARFQDTPKHATLLDLQQAQWIDDINGRVVELLRESEVVNNVQTLATLIYGGTYSATGTCNPTRFRVFGSFHGTAGSSVAMQFWRYMGDSEDDISWPTFVNGDTAHATLFVKV